MSLPRLTRLHRGLSTACALLYRRSGGPQLAHFTAARHLTSPHTPVTLTDYGIFDGERELLHIETRNMCRCEQCFGRHSHHKTNLPDTGGNLYPEVRVTEVGRISDHYITLTWSDGHTGLIARTQEGEYGPDPVPHLADKYLNVSMRLNKSQQFWAAPSPDNTKMFDYRSVVGSLDALREFYAHYMVHGIAFLENMPEGRGLKEMINEDLRCGPIRCTVFDEVDVVKMKPEPLSAGYSTSSLAGHTDLNYYYQAPHVQIFHSFHNTVKGGESFWVDAFSAMSEVREERPDYFHTLSTVPVFHRFTPPGTAKYVRSHHTVVNMLGDDLKRISDNPWSTDTPQATRTLDRATREAWWEAYLYYRAKVEDPSRWIIRKLRSGEAVMTDNWRVYHGRKEFKIEPGQERVVATAYINWNHLQRILLSPEEAEPCYLQIENH